MYVIAFLDRSNVSFAQQEFEVDFGISAAAYAFAAFVLSAPLGLVLALVPEPLYDFYADAPERVWGISRLTDQQLGGMTMAGEQSVVFFAVFAYWFLRFLSEQERAEEEVA